MDIAAGNKLVDLIKPLAKATSRSGKFAIRRMSHDERKTCLNSAFVHQGVLQSWEDLQDCLT